MNFGVLRIMSVTTTPGCKLLTVTPVNTDSCHAVIYTQGARKMYIFSYSLPVSIHAHEHTHTCIKLIILNGSIS